MTALHMITFRCRPSLFERLEEFAVARNVDRTSVLKLAVHYYLNLHQIEEAKRMRRRKSRKPRPKRCAQV